jgi:hypothetical protein
MFVSNTTQQNFVTDYRVSPDSLGPVYPSQYWYDRRCAYKFVLSRLKDVTALPASPRAELGTIIHSLYHWSFLNRRSGVTEQQATQKFDQLVLEAEQRMSASPLSASLVPLSISCDVYLTRRHAAIRHSQRPAVPVSTIHFKSGRQFSEEGFSSEDGLIKGSLDALYIEGDIIDIVDRKTGEVSKDGILRESYTTQLKLYAGLVADTFGVMPRSLVLIDGTSNRWEVPFTIEEVSALYLSAKNWLTSIKDEVVNRPDNLHELADPRPSNCKDCRYRANCRPYWESLRQGSQGYAYDLMTTFEGIEHYPLATVLKFSGYDSSLSFRIKQDMLHNFVEILDLLKKGDKILIMNASICGRQLEANEKTVLLKDIRKSS